MSKTPIMRNALLKQYHLENCKVLRNTFIQGLQAHTVIFDSQITGSRNAIFSSLRTFLKSVQKHNSHTTISYFESWAVTWKNVDFQNYQNSCFIISPKLWFVKTIFKDYFCSKWVANDSSLNDMAQACKKSR